MLKKMILVRGAPGSGKSTISQQYKAKHHDSCYVCSTDEYWMRPDGVYDFNWELLGKSHVWNQWRVLDIAKDNQHTCWDTIIVVDNTNITFSEMRPYINIAMDYGYEIEFVEPDTPWKYDVEECFKRNSHGVPYATILKMNQKWEDHATVMVKLEKLKNGQ